MIAMNTAFPKDIPSVDVEIMVVDYSKISKYGSSWIENGVRMVKSSSYPTVW